MVGVETCSEVQQVRELRAESCAEDALVRDNPGIGMCQATNAVRGRSEAFSVSALDIFGHCEKFGSFVQTCFLPGFRPSQSLVRITLICSYHFLYWVVMLCA